MKYHRPVGVIAVGIFLIFGVVIAFLAGITLLFPGTFLDNIWIVNQAGHRALTGLEFPVGVAFEILAILLLVITIGWWKLHRWGWQLTISIITTNMIGDVTQIIWGDVWKGLMGIILAGILLTYLLTPGIKQHFISSKREKI